MNQFIPHMHTCEVKLCRPGTWADYCPLRGELSETQDECEECKHFVVIEFNPENHLSIQQVVHVNT